MKGKRIRWCVLVLAGIAGLGLVSCASSRSPQITITTPLGRIEAEVFIDEAPISAQAFLRNVDAGVYRDGRAAFYRVVRMDNQPENEVKIEVVQGGVDRETGDTGVPYIPHETTAVTGLTHRDGSLSLARMEPGTANTEFSICIGPQPELDFGGRRNPDGQGFAVFGQVTRGMDVVRRIQQMPETAQYLDSPVSFTIQRETR
ncbi:peptidylprolyl isomerase [Haloferula sp. A504]|uniref:peptidylprolyl isomerase n=1 Tax=Haloferula sp. A504 TaxID=3373601 RepID=UPI0031C9F8C1|nr:peptidylprolyl isomerase [Verrucomicrobiaceae bacterium E54]